MTTVVTTHAYAKINLSIDVLGKRNDGYHQVEMLMQSISLRDRITIKPYAGLEVRTDSNETPNGEKNLAYQAALLLQRESGCKNGARIFIEKRIPVAAGLAGGSSDAAAVLVALNNLWALHLPLGRLVHLAGKLGSDVPFCLLGGTGLATGRGERVTLLPPAPHLWLVLAKPSFGVPTAQVYNNLVLEEVKCTPDTDVLTEAIEQGRRGQLLAGMVNVLEYSTFKLYPKLKELKEQMYQLGAEKVMMCGSGPTVFAVTSDANAAETLRRNLLSQDHFVTVAETI